MNMSRIKLKLKTLPDTPGIYLFYDAKKKLVYVGKATSLKSRVRSYFSGKKTPRPIEEMIHEVKDIKIKKTESVLEAVILEAVYIKRHLPKYNVMGKDNKSWNYITITKEEYPRVVPYRSHQLQNLTTKQKTQDFLHIFGPYPGINTRATLKLLRKMFGFCSCKPGQKSCLYYQMKQCRGVFKKEITPAAYKKEVIRPLSLFLQGNKKEVLKRFERNMKAASKREKFEEAARLRNQIGSLQRIYDIALINKSFFQDEWKNVKSIRIEGYDISNLGSTGVVGSMVVFQNGEPAKDQYRKFRIKTVEGQNDVASLAEMLERRIKHPEWRYPDVFLIDGGKPQVNRALKVIRGFGMQTPVIGIAKGSARKKNEFILSSRKKSLTEFVQENKKTLIRVRDEAHRFAIKYQRTLRKIKK
jgi:excinuclease ABC subunit C